MEDDQRTSVADELCAAFVAAFPRYVAERIVSLGADPGAFSATIEEGTAGLESELGALLSAPPGTQRRAPLEVVRAALAPVTAALGAAGVEVPERDAATSEALPDDPYDLGPASSQALGERAWRAHLAWGIAKAEAVAGVIPATSPQPDAPTDVKPAAAVVLVGTDLMDRSKISNVVAAAGLSFEVWRNPAAVAAGLDAGTPALALVDLTHQASDDVVRRLAAAGVRVVAFGPHVDDFALVRARSLGAADALPRSRFFRTLPDLLPKLA